MIKNTGIKRRPVPNWWNKNQPRRQKSNLQMKEYRIAHQLIRRNAGKIEKIGKGLVRPGARFSDPQTEWT